MLTNAVADATRRLRCNRLSTPSSGMTYRLQYEGRSGTTHQFTAAPRQPDVRLYVHAVGDRWACQ